MSSREPLWYCHECRAEMRPLMVPDPHCASCNGTFVEKLEDPADDPRQFTHGVTDDDDPFGPDDFIFGLRNLMGAGLRNPASPPLAGSPPRFGGRGAIPPSNGTSGYTIRINRTSAPGQTPRTTISTGTPRVSDIPSLSEFARQTGRPDRGTIDGPLMFQYLLAMMSQPGQGGRNGPMSDLFEGMMAGGPEAGRMGDYVFNQEALDQIITQLMENSSAHPVAATDEIMQKLPREVLEEKSPLLEKDCAVCKEQFQLGTEDPDEQVVVTLPCKHPFHEPCIMPWLKSSGTCPVCRYQLVPQPSHGAPGPGPPSGSASGDANRSRNTPGSPGGNGVNGGAGSPEQRSPGQQGPALGGGPAGILGSLFSMFGNAVHAAAGNNADRNEQSSGSASSSSSRDTTSRSPRHSRSPSDPYAPRRNGNNPPRSGNNPSRNDQDDHEFPGGWNGVD